MNVTTCGTNSYLLKTTGSISLARSLSPRIDLSPWGRVLSPLVRGRVLLEPVDAVHLICTVPSAAAPKGREVRTVHLLPGKFTVCGLYITNGSQLAFMNLVRITKVNSPKFVLLARACMRGEEK